MPDAHIDKAGLFHAAIRELVDQWPPKSRSVSDNAFVWVRNGSPQEIHWFRKIETKRGGGVNPPKPVIISRKWGAEFASWRHIASPEDSVYGIFSLTDISLRSNIFSIYRRLERAIYRSFPACRRKRWVSKTKHIRSFEEIGVIDIPSEFFAYLIWKAYWLDTGSVPSARGHKKKSEALCQFRLQLSKVYWRYLQHARLLRPSGMFSTADEWAHLHFFSIVAKATYRAALDLVGSVQLRCRPFRANRCARLETAVLPVVMLAQNSLNPETYELRVWWRNSE